jgi:hypothetical protein
MNAVPGVSLLNLISCVVCYPDFLHHPWWLVWGVDGTEGVVASSMPSTISLLSIYTFCWLSFCLLYPPYDERLYLNTITIKGFNGTHGVQLFWLVPGRNVAQGKIGIVRQHQILDRIYFSLVSPTDLFPTGLPPILEHPSFFVVEECRECCHGGWHF